MKKRDWFLVLFFLFFTWGIDQLTKYIALETIIGIKSFGPLHLVIHRNPGAMLGIFSDLPPLLRVVSLSTGGAFLVFIYGALQYLIPQKSMTIRLGMSLLLGGILGNVTDRILDGAIVDFIVLRAFNLTSPAFNLADAIQWIGYFMVIGSLIKNGNQFWPESNERKKLWINPMFQSNYILFLVGTGLSFALINGVFTYTFLHVTVDELQTHFNKAPHGNKSFTEPFLITYFVISLSFIILLFIIGRKLSHRTAGPVFAFELFIKDLLSGKKRAFKLRQGDNFLHLEETASLILNHFEKYSYIHEKLNDEEFDIRHFLKQNKKEDEKAS